jgi:membrane protein DedA with SNARE-associated domain
VTFLLHGSLILIFLWLVVGAVGVPLPEDLAVLTTGVLVHRGVVELPIAVAVIFAGALGGDTLLFMLARRVGPALYQRPTFRRLVPERRRARIEGAYQRHGGRLVFFARFIPGTRAAVFVMAAIHGMKLRRFLAYDALAACVGLPIVISLGYFASQHVAQMHHDLAIGRELALVILALGALVFVTWRHVRVPPTEP